MTPAPTDWVTPVVVLTVGMILGILIYTLFGKRRGNASTAADLELRDLEARRDALLRELRELGDEHPPERARLESEAALVLRQLDGKQPRGKRAAAATATAPPAAAPQGNPAMRGFLWGAGSVAALALLAYLVVQQAKPRTEGGQLTGDIPGQQQQPGQPAAAPPDPVLQQLEAAIQKTPDNLALRNELAKAYLERDNLMGTFEQTQYVLTRAPRDSRALTYQGIVRMAMGDAQSATTMLDAATESDPKLLDAWVAKAWLNFQLGKVKEAESIVAEAAKIHPDQKEKLEQLLTQMRMQAANAGQQQQPSQLPADHPPIPAAGGGAQPAPPSDPRAVTIAVEVSDAVRARSANGMVFVIARAAGVTAGPPIAAKRLSVSDLAAPITVSQSDSMMGQPLPDKLRIEVRIDSDGVPTTRDPNDPAASADNVAAGSSVKLKLQ